MRGVHIQWTNSEVPGTIYGMTDSGWMDNFIKRTGFRAFYAIWSQVAHCFC